MSGSSSRPTGKALAKCCELLPSIFTPERYCFLVLDCTCTESQLQVDTDLRGSSSVLSVCRYMEVSGFHGIVAGCLVAVKQIMPDTEVTLVRVVKFHAKASAQGNIMLL